MQHRWECWDKSGIVGSFCWHAVCLLTPSASSITGTGEDFRLVTTSLSPILLALTMYWSDCCQGIQSGVYVLQIPFAFMDYFKMRGFFSHWNKHRLEQRTSITKITCVLTLDAFKSTTLITGLHKIWHTVMYPLHNRCATIYFFTLVSLYLHSILWDLLTHNHKTWW